MSFNTSITEEQIKLDWQFGSRFPITDQTKLTILKDELSRLVSSKQEFRKFDVRALCYITFENNNVEKLGINTTKYVRYRSRIHECSQVLLDLMINIELDEKPVQRLSMREHSLILEYTKFTP